MMYVPGACDRCGVQLLWTLDRAGETWVTCADPKCLPAQLVFPFLDSEWPEEMPKAGWWIPGMEPSERGRVSPPEGGAADEKERSVTEVEEPPVGWLSSMWLGGPDGER